MKDKIIKYTKFIGLGFLEPLIRLISGEQPKKHFKETSQRLLIPILSVFVFIFVWHSGSKALYNIEAEARIVKVLNDQGEEAAEEMRNCIDRKSTRLNSSHVKISYAVFCLK